MTWNQGKPLREGKLLSLTSKDFGGQRNERYAKNYHEVDNIGRLTNRVEGPYHLEIISIK